MATLKSVLTLRLTYEFKNCAGVAKLVARSGLKTRRSLTVRVRVPFPAPLEI